MSIHYDQIGQLCATFLNPNNVAVGSPCELSGNNTITPCSDGNDFIGIVINTRGEYATVVLRGFVTIPYGAFTPSCGFCCLGANEDGTVGALGGCRQYLITNVDTEAGTVTFLM